MRSATLATMSPRIVTRWTGRILGAELKGSQETPTAIADRQAGFTLVELMVTSLCLIIVTTMVFLTLVSAYGSESRVSAISQASSQITQAFMQLDSEIGYASDIQYGSSGSNYFVWFQSPGTTTSQDEPQCTEIEYNNSTGVLQQQSWWPTSAAAPGTWRVIASGLETNLSTDPFSWGSGTGPAGTAPWQLAVTLASTSGAGTTAETAHSSFTITALNTNQNSSSTSVCGGPS